MKNTEKFLKEIAGKKYPYLLDYLSICIQRPEQKLPVIALYSNGVSGKSTFLKLVNLIFPEKTIYSDANFDERHRAILANSYFLIEESFNETFLEKLKQWNSTLRINDFIFLSRFFVASNVEIGFETESIWQIKVPLIIKKDLTLLYKLENEVDSFRSFLKEREISTEKNNRFWFNPKELKE